MTAPGLSVVVTICATTFFGAVAGDTLFSVFQRLFIIHRSSFYHSFELVTTTFFGAVAGDTLFSVFQQLFIIHRSSFYHSLEPATPTFFGAVAGDRVFSVLGPFLSSFSVFQFLSGW